MSRSALITGVSGQDGSYLAENLLSRGYRVTGVARHDRPANASTVPEESSSFRLAACDITKPDAVLGLIDHVRPDEIYNFAAMSSGSGMFSEPIRMAATNGFAVTCFLEAIRSLDTSIRFCQAGSREVYGDAARSPQDESTPCQPRSPYGAAKLYAQNMVRLYRERFGLHASNAILYNHESPRRGADFVSRKVVNAAVAIHLDGQGCLDLGDIDAIRDWGYAPDYVEAMRLMVQARSADDYVVATGEGHSVRELCELAFGHFGMDWREHVRAHPAQARPSEPAPLVGNASKLRHALGWSPQTTFSDMVRLMVEHELDRALRTRGTRI